MRRPPSPDVRRGTALRCALVDSNAHMEAIQRLRFAVLIEEIGRSSPYADSRTRRIAEPLDAGARHLAAFLTADEDEARTPSGRIVGALRIHGGESTAARAIESIYGFAPGRLGPHSLVVKRLVTLPDVRGGEKSAGLALAQAAYQIALEEATQEVFIDCTPELVPFFEYLGFDPLRAFHDAEMGEVWILRIDPFDGARLERTGSPFLDALARWRAAIDEPESPSAPLSDSSAAPVSP